MTPLGGPDGEGEREVRALLGGGNPRDGARCRAGDGLRDEYGSEIARPR